MEKVISLLGYPNSGKTSVFNLLTKSRRKVANFAGVTTDYYSQNAEIEGKTYKIVDLPGVNSLASFSSSKDELVVSDYVENNKDSVYLNIVNITQLEKHLMLTLNALAKGFKVILVLNMVDKTNLNNQELERVKNILASNLAVPVVLLSSKTGFGLEELKKEVQQIDNSFIDNKLSKLTVKERVEKTKSVCNQIGDLKIKSNKITNCLDKVFLNNFLSIPLFFVAIYLILFITMSIHATFVDLIDEFAGIYFINLPNKILTFLGVPELVNIVVAQGIGSGIQTMLTFVPIIFTLFFLLGFLEQSGYMARQVYIADGVMQSFGLSGKSFVPLIMNFGCTVACSSGCRVLEKEQDRRLTLMLSPSVSCSARLAVYVYLAYICFEGNALNVVFAMYILGIVFLVVNGLFLSKSLIKTDPSAFIVELPNYQVPNFKTLAFNALLKLKGFLFGIGKTIVPVVAIIVVLNSISFKGKIVEDGNKESVLAHTSKFITPVLNPIGISNNNYEATFALITGFLAKEIVVATLGSLYFTELEQDQEQGIIESSKTALLNFKNVLLERNYIDFLDFESSKEDIGDNLGEKKQVLLEKFNGIHGIIAFLIFLVLYTPCVAAMGSIVNEIGKKWAFAVAFWSLFNAYAMAFLYYQLASTAFGLRGILLSALMIGVYAIIFFIFKYLGNKHKEQWNSGFIISKKKC